MFSRYSSNVVAPIHCISPRDSAGLMMFEASNEPEELPVPMMVCISSIKTTTLSLSTNSSKIALSLSSNCPRYLVPATTEVKSNETIRLSAKFLGQSPWCIFIANPSTIAVLPEPGSPITIGLFFLRRDKICAILLISFSLPITGSSFPCSANLIKSREKLSNTGVLESFLLFFIGSLLFPPCSSNSVSIYKNFFFVFDSTNILHFI